MALMTRLTAKEARRQASRAKTEAKIAEQARTRPRLTLIIRHRQKKASSPTPKTSSVKQEALPEAEDPTLTNKAEEEFDELDPPASRVLARVPEYKPPVKMRFDFAANKISVSH